MQLIFISCIADVGTYSGYSEGGMCCKSGHFDSFFVSRLFNQSSKVALSTNTYRWVKTIS